MWSFNSREMICGITQLENADMTLWDVKNKDNYLLGEQIKSPNYGSLYEKSKLIYLHDIWQKLKMK